MVSWGCTWCIIKWKCKTNIYLFILDVQLESIVLFYIFFNLILQGTKVVEGFTLMLPRTTNTKCLSTLTFKKMKKLRLLQLAGVQLAGDFKNLSRDLRWLCWHGFPLKCIPTDFYQGSLVSIELENSNISHMWKEALVLIFCLIFGISWIIFSFLIYGCNLG